MTDYAVNSLEVTAEARQAARDFATALTRTPEFKAFESASDRMQQDPAAQRARAAYQRKQPAGPAPTATPEDQAELDRLYRAFLDEPSVVAVLEAQTELQALCREAAERLSARIGLSYAAVCGSCHCS
jgi:cell fate (sporulation/competence/biofilm development) regulator YlbF (YheA/YmcA/DUF963 family)